MKYSFYCLPLKQNVKAKVTGIVKKKSFGIKGEYKHKGKTYNCHKVCSKAEAERVSKESGIDITYPGMEAKASENVAEAVRAYAEELNQQNRERRAQTDIDRKAFDKIERGIAGIMSAIEDGMYQPSMKTRMDDLERQKVEILARMEDVPADVPDIHPNIAQIYKAKVTQLNDALADPELHNQAAEAIRALVGEVVLMPGDKRGEVNATLRGELMGILDIVSGRKTQNRSQVITKEVACPRYQHYPSTILDGFIWDVLKAIIIR